MSRGIEEAGELLHRLRTFRGGERMLRLLHVSGPLLLLLHGGPVAAAVVVDALAARPNPVHHTRDSPAELEVEVSIRDRGVTRILGCQLALDFGDGTPDFVHQFMDGGPRKTVVKHVYRKPGIYNVRARGAAPGRERVCEAEKHVQVIVVGEPEAGQSEAAKEAATLTLCPQSWSLVPGSQTGTRFKCRPDKPLTKIECQGGAKYFEQDGMIGCQ
jgi:hypothetical protein